MVEIDAVKKEEIGPTVITQQELAWLDHQIVMMPANAHVTSVALVNSDPVVFFRAARVPLVGREFLMLRNGEPIPGNEYRLIGTLLPNGDVVRHVFERRPGQ